MFTGIVETMGEVIDIYSKGSNLTFSLRSSVTKELRIDQSILHNGVCLTVEDILGDQYQVTAIRETLERSNLGAFSRGDYVNLERSVKPDSFLDGHMVQGHVDTVSECLFVKDLEGSWEFGFAYESKNAALLVQKGSICLNGVSLTIADLKDDHFTVAIIPYTFENTNFGQIREGMKINTEFDILGKYMLRYLETTGARTQ